LDEFEYVLGVIFVVGELLFLSTK